MQLSRAWRDSCERTSLRPEPSRRTGGVVWHAENPRVYIQNARRVHIHNVPVCTGTTPASVTTCGRGAGTHGDVLNVHTRFSACHTHRTHTQRHAQPNTATTHIITRRQGQRETERARQKEDRGDVAASHSFKLLLRAAETLRRHTLFNCCWPIRLPRKSSSGSPALLQRQSFENLTPAACYTAPSPIVEYIDQLNPTLLQRQSWRVSHQLCPTLLTPVVKYFAPVVDAAPTPAVAYTWPAPVRSTVIAVLLCLRRTGHGVHRARPRIVKR